MLRSDIIAAISTPPGKGGVALIRLSGDGAIGLTEKFFRAASRRKVTDYPLRTQIYGYVMDGERILDDGMLTCFGSGASYTGEETVEITCHGGILVSELVLATLLKAGARAAEAGEFTRRAFLNGRLSLSDAEAIGLLLEAKSEEQIAIAGKESRDRLSEKIGAIAKKMTELLGSVYARIDYPDEDLGDFTDEEMLGMLKDVRRDLDSLITTYRTGHSIAEGIKTAIIGKPNVGKSSLYNILCGRDAAIVTDIAGTTRDVLEDTVTLGKVTLRLADTAGIRADSADPVEKIGIERSLSQLEESELILAVADAALGMDSEIAESVQNSSAAKIAIYNKVDKIGAGFAPVCPEGFDRAIAVSATASPDEARDAICRVVEELFIDGRISVGADAIVSSARQRAELAEAREAIIAAIEAISVGVFADAVSSDVEIALGAVSRVDGRAVSEAVVDNIFSRFCVGK